ncbi:MAG TPA: hypothetical protein VN132_03950 [Bdellovibrio sp.]|nr:hypothetical protein [Bdellovibrio sp.]
MKVFLFSLGFLISQGSWASGSILDQISSGTYHAQCADGGSTQVSIVVGDQKVIVEIPGLQTITFSKNKEDVRYSVAGLETTIKKGSNEGAAYISERSSRDLGFMGKGSSKSRVVLGKSEGQLRIKISGNVNLDCLLIK